MQCGGCCFIFVVQVLSSPQKSLQLSALKLMRSTDKSYTLQQGLFLEPCSLKGFILLLPASYFLGDFHAVFLYPYLTSPGFCWSFVASAVLGCLLLMLQHTISSLEVVNLNHVGLAKVIVSAISLLSFGIPAVPQDYFFWTVLSLLAGMFVPKVTTSDADKCVFSNIRQSMEHV